VVLVEAAEVAAHRVEREEVAVMKAVARVVAVWEV